MYGDGAKAVLNAGELQAMLGGGEVTVKTGAGATNIFVKDSFSWTSTARLTLDANQSVMFYKPVTMAGSGAVTIAYNDGGSNGDLLFSDKANLTFWDLASSLIINGSSYTLAGDIATLAAEIAANSSGFYALANSYDARHDSFATVPITTSFSGIFEGLGQTISRLQIEHPFNRRQGLFAHVVGTVRDLTLVKVNIHASDDDDAVVGALAGLNYGTLINISADGIVQGNAGAMGGIVGWNQGGTMINLSSAVAVTGRKFAGGLLGSALMVSLSGLTPAAMSWRLRPEGSPDAVPTSACHTPRDR